MRTPSPVRLCLAFLLCLVLALPAFPQFTGPTFSGSGPGPSKGEIVAAIIGAAAVIAVTVVVVYRVTHKHPSLTGCVASGAAGMSLTNAKDKKIYALSGDLSALQDGQQFTVKGKKSKDPSGQFAFHVEKITKSLGPCHP